MLDIAVTGVGIRPFGRFDADYRELGAVAARRAVADAGIPWQLSSGLGG